MRKVLFLFLLVFLLVSVPGRAAADDAPRNVVLTETLRLQDGQADVFFKNPRRIHEVTGKWIYLLDDQRALKFDAAGKGFGEVVPRGEGPGELTRVHYVDSLDGQLVLLSVYPFKVLLAEPDGTFKREFRPQDQGHFYNLELVWNGRLLLSRRKQDFISGAKQGVSAWPVELTWMDMKARNEPLNLAGISEMIYMNKLNLAGGRVAVAINEVCALKACADTVGKKLYLAYTPRYAVDVVDLATGKRLSTLKRPHKTVDYYAPPREEDEEEEPRQFEPYEPEEFNDVLAIHHVLGELWVVTSDFARERGFRVDRFDAGGNFTGSVFLKVPGVVHPDDLDRRILEFTADHLWVNVQDEDENPVPVRYRMSVPN